MPRSSALFSVSLATTLMASAWGQNVISARPGTISYIEGQVSLGRSSGGESLNNQSVGSASLRTGETLETTEGRAEVQLTPGIFLRVGQNSIVRMVSASLIHTVVEVQRGRAEIEADQVFEQNDVRVMLGGGLGESQTQVVKPGLYEFDANAGVVRVFEGKAEVSLGANSEKAVAVKGGHLLALNGDSSKPQSFNKKRSTDELTEWSDVRSQYVGQENVGLVQSGGGYGNGFGTGGYGLGYGSYPWFPGGAGFYNPYGLGLYSSFYGGPFGFGYPGFGSGFYGGSGFGYGGLGYGFGGYGGGYGYLGGGGPYNGLGVRSGYSGQLSNRGGVGRPLPGQGSSGLNRSGQGSAIGAPGARSSSGGIQGGARSGGFGGGGGGGSSAGASHGGGGGSHR